MATLAKLTRRMQQGPWSEAFVAIGEASEKQLQLDAMYYSAAIGTCSRRQKWTKALELLDFMICTAVVVDFIAGSAAVSALPWLGAVQVLQQLQDANLQMNVIPFDASITACGKASELAAALEVYRDIHSWNLQKTVITYSALISACKSSSAWQEALEKLMEAESSGVQLDVILYSAAISACEKAEEWTLALLLFQRLQSIHLEPNIINYNATMTACEKASHWEVTLHLLKEALFRRLRSDVISYAACASGCEKAAKWEEALCLLRSAEIQDVPINTILCNAVISACGTTDGWKLTFELMKKIEVMQLATDSYNAAIDACLDQWTQALRIFAELQKTPYAEPDLISFNSAMHGLCLAQKWQHALHLLRYAEAVQLVPDAASYSPLLLAAMSPEAEPRKPTRKRKKIVLAPDLAQRRGVRVHALDTSSFLRSCVDLSDVDIQAMFDHWFLRLSRSRQKSLQAPLKQFLLLLLDAAYFDMPDGSELRLRVPSVIPALPPDPEQELIEVAKAPELTKEWIRDQILVPKAMGVSASRPSSGKLKPSKASRSSGYGCYARSASRGHSQGPPRPARPSSARMAVLASPRRSSSISQSLGSGSMSECLPTTASYAESERSVRARSRGMRLRWPMEEREEAWSNLAPPSYSQVMTESRRLRPSSAKVHKHKRVTPAEAWENEEDIYDDLEPSVAGDLEHCSEFLGQDLSEAFGRQSEPPMRGGWIQEGMM